MSDKLKNKGKGSHHAYYLEYPTVEILEEVAPRKTPFTQSPMFWVGWIMTAFLTYALFQAYGKIQIVTDSWDAIHGLYEQNEQYLPEYQVLCK